MAKEKKLSLEELIKKTDAAKKKNPLDLSSDQDLSIALMNLISLEEHFFFSGGKTQKPDYYDLINIVRDMRGELMKRIVKRDGHDGGEIWCISKHLLAASMRLMEVGTKAMGVGNKKDAHDFFNKAYDLYSLFWGINMELVDLKGIRKADGPLPRGLDIWVEDIAKTCNAGKNKIKSQTRPTKIAPKKFGDGKTLTGRLGAWVKNAVNCCIE